MEIMIQFVRPGGAASERRARGIVFAVFLGLSAWSQRAYAQAQDLKGADPSKSSLAVYVPRQDLVFLLEFDGLDAHAAAWKNSAAYKLLNETKLGALLEDLARQGIGLTRQSNHQASQLKPAEIIEIVKHAARHGGVTAVWGQPPQPTNFVTVVRNGDRPEFHRMVASEAAAHPRRPGRGAVEPAVTKKAGRTLHLVDEGGAWWIEHGDLVVTGRPDAVIDVLDGKEPSAVDHPLRARLRKARDGFVPVGTGFLDITALPPMPPDLVQLGFEGFKRIELQWGIQDDALLTVLDVVAPAPRQGAPALFDQPPFTVRSLPPLPASLTDFIVLSIDLRKTYDQIIALIKQTNPQGAEGFAALEQALSQQFRVDLGNDVLGQLGPKLSFYIQAPAKVAGADPATAMLSQFSGLVVSAQVRDPSAFARTFDPLMKAVNRIIQAQQAAARGNRPDPNAPVIAFRKQDGPGSTYVLDLPEGSLPPPLLAVFRPTITLGKEQLVIAATTASAERVASLASKEADRLWRPTGAFVPMANRLPSDLILLNVNDPRESMPAFIESLPVFAQQINMGIAQAHRHSGRPGEPAALNVDPNTLPGAEAIKRLLFPGSFALVADRQGARIVLRDAIPSIGSPAASGVLIGLLLPAVQSAREAARRAQCVNNLRQIALAMHNYHDANNAFPKPAITGKDGKPLLSWRVAILPYIEQNELYNRFHLDEPWDSPHNKALLKEMPATYQCASRTVREPFTTAYRVFSGKGALFEDDLGTTIAHVTDGTSNTMMVVESREEVPWTKPDELKFDPAAKPSLYGAGSSHPGGFNTAFADGSVRFIKNSIAVAVFRNLITRAGGEVISADQF
jgi:prepilin-type processing-associated H-X9-DG protein